MPKAIIGFESQTYSVTALQHFQALTTFEALQVSALQQGMNVTDEVADGIKNAIESIEYEFKHDDTVPMFTNQLEDGKEGAASSNDAQRGATLAIKDDDTYPPQVLLNAAHTSDLNWIECLKDICLKG